MGLIESIVPATELLATANQRLPSGPAVIPKGSEDAVTGTSPTKVWECVSIFPTPNATKPVNVELITPSVYQILPSGPTAIPKGSSEPPGSATSFTMVPLFGLKIPMAPNSVNQRLPSGPRTILEFKVVMATGAEYSVM